VLTAILSARACLVQRAASVNFANVALHRKSGGGGAGTKGGAPTAAGGDRKANGAMAKGGGLGASAAAAAVEVRLAACPHCCVRV
jgi:hypothetical protein